MDENILLIRLKSIGDILFTLPSVHAIRENFPGARLHFLVSRENAPLLRGFADVNEIIPLDRAIFRSWNFPAACADAFRLVRQLRRKKFSLAVDFQGYGETALLGWWSGAPMRWGREREWLYTRGARHHHEVHPAGWNLSLLRQGGLRIGEIRNEFVLPAESFAEARKFFAANHLDETGPVLFIQPFTSTPAKNWPLDKFLELAGHWRSRGVPVIFGGGAAEREALEPARAAGFPVAAGVPLLVSAGLMKLSTLVIGADTGLLHLAVAMGKRVVMLMQSNAPGNSHPFMHPEWAILPTARQAVSKIQVNTVIETTERAFNERTGNVSC
ncbi:MAG TPA: glycosyltransferase family 9 protein [Verrucomicrobiae bacterium]|nr:glycosyltransferase family 9 protein [Verrucomicrobiae bacterium]